jgi:hypothetical protein
MVAQGEAVTALHARGRARAEVRAGALDAAKLASNKQRETAATWIATVESGHKRTIMLARAAIVVASVSTALALGAFVVAVVGG